MPPPLEGAAARVVYGIAPKLYRAVTATIPETGGSDHARTSSEVSRESSPEE